MTGDRQPPAAAGPQLSISVSLSEIYDCLCSSCRDNVLRMIADKGGGELVLNALRQQLEASRHPEPVEGPPDEHR